MRPRTALFIVLLVAAGFRCQQGAAATTADGVALINQATAATGLPGCPTTGFPIVICHQGSYRLSGNLTISDADVSVIQIAADNVTLDLNGFTIAGPVTCADRPQGAGGCSPHGYGKGIYSLDHDNTWTTEHGQKTDNQFFTPQTHDEPVFQPRPSHGQLGARRSSASRTRSLCADCLALPERRLSK